MALFEHWLEKTYVLQRSAYNVDPPSLEGEEFVEYVRWNTLAAHTELSEFLQCIPWKPWSKHRHLDRLARDDALGEIVDVLHFIGNILLALGVTDRELNAAYTAKMQLNQERQDSGTY